MTHGYGLLEIVGKPLRSGCRVAREGKCLRRDFAFVARNGKCDRAQVGRVSSANQVNSRSALAVHPLAVNGVERPGAVECKSARRSDARFVHMHRIERLNGMQTNIRKARRWSGRNHGKILAEAKRHMPNVSPRQRESICCTIPCKSKDL